MRHLALRAAMLVRWYWAADRLINSCPLHGGECMTCSVICCPHKEPLHFHHDGCPCCCDVVHEEER